MERTQDFGLVDDTQNRWGVPPDEDIDDETGCAVPIVTHLFGNA